MSIKKPSLDYQTGKLLIILYEHTDLSVKFFVYFFNLLFNLSAIYLFDGAKLIFSYFLCTFELLNFFFLTLELQATVFWTPCINILVKHQEMGST